MVGFNRKPKANLKGPVPFLFETHRQRTSEHGVGFPYVFVANLVSSLYITVVVPKWLVILPNYGVIDW